MGTTAYAAGWFLPLVIPICIYVAYSDMKSMIIPNKAVYALLAVFAVLGYFAFPDLSEYLWRYLHLVIVLVIGIAMNAARMMGAGDAKFMAAAAPFIAVSDLGFLLLVFILSLLGGYALHRLAKKSPLRKLAPDWQSWDSGRRFPMGFPLATALVAYLLFAYFQSAPVAIA